MPRTTGIYMTTATGGEAVNAFVPLPLPPAEPALDPACYAGNAAAEQALGRLSAMSGLVASAEWLIYSSIRKEALLTSQMEGTQATLTDLLDEESGMDVAKTKVAPCGSDTADNVTVSLSGSLALTEKERP